MNVRGRSILIFGDSMTHRGANDAPNGVDVVESANRRGSPGDLLASHLLAAGASRARINAKVGRSAYSFYVKEPAAAAELAAEVARRPQIVIVFLGTNDLGLSVQTDATYMARLRDAFLAGGAEVWAVGPPSFAPTLRACAKRDAAKTCVSWGPLLNDQAVGVLGMMRSVFGASRVIDARPLTADIVTVAQGRAGDLIHFVGSTGAPRFALRLAQAVLAAGTAVATTSSAPSAWNPSSWSSPAMALTPIGLLSALQRATAAGGLLGDVSPTYSEHCPYLATVADVQALAMAAVELLSKLAQDSPPGLDGDEALAARSRLRKHVSALAVLDPQASAKLLLGGLQAVICSDIADAWSISAAFFQRPAVLAALHDFLSVNEAANVVVTPGTAYPGAPPVAPAVARRRPSQGRMAFASVVSVLALAGSVSLVFGRLGKR